MVLDLLRLKVATGNPLRSRKLSSLDFSNSPLMSQRRNCWSVILGNKLTICLYSLKLLKVWSSNLLQACSIKVSFKLVTQNLTEWLPWQQRMLNNRNQNMQILVKFLSRQKMNALTFSSPSQNTSFWEKFLFLNKSISIQKNFLRLTWFLFISSLVAMTTVKISFVFFLHGTVSVYQISNHYLFK